MANVLVNENSLSAIAAAIRNKAGTADTFRPGEMAAAISNIPVQTEEPPRKDVNFYNYDGKRLFSYTLAEVQAMSTLPEYPGEDGITFVEWNWTLAKLKAHAGRMNVGACCVASGNTTVIYGRADVEQEITIALRGTIVPGVIDWGDGTIESYEAGQQYHTHTLGVGDHEIRLTTESAEIDLGYNSFVTGVKFAATHKAYGYNCCSRAKWAAGGNIANLNGYGRSAVCVIVPKGTTSAGMLKGLVSCKHICFGEDITSVSTGGTSFQNISALEEIYTPRLSSAPVFYVNRQSFGIEGLQDIYIPYNGTYPDDFARYSYALSHVVIPEGVTGLGSGNFLQCRPERLEFPTTLTTINSMGLYPRVVVFKSNTPPTISSSNPFGAASDSLKKIIVPTGRLGAYKAATNLSQYADIMEEG